MTIYYLHTWTLDGDTYEFIVHNKRLIGSLNGEILPIEGLPGEFKNEISPRLIPTLRELLKRSFFSFELISRIKLRAIRIQPMEGFELYENLCFDDYRLSANG